MTAIHTLREVPSGDAGVAATLQEMRSIVRAWRAHPRVRELALQITSGCPPRDWACEVRALQQWIKAHVRFVGDVHEIETLQTPDVTLDQAAGDCDDQCILLASMLQSIGHPVRFVAVDFGQGFSHVYCETPIGPSWFAVETTEDWELGQQPRGVRRSYRANV